MNEYKLRPIKFLWQLLNRTISEAKVYILGYRNYTALLTQTGTDAPVATVLENTIGNITWYYFEPGKSGGTFPTVPDWDKIVIFIGQTNSFNIIYALNSDYNILVGDFTNDGTLNNTPIEIRVYN